MIIITGKIFLVLFKSDVLEKLQVKLNVKYWMIEKDGQAGLLFCFS